MTVAYGRYAILLRLSVIVVSLTLNGCGFVSTPQVQPGFDVYAWVLLYVPEVAANVAIGALDTGVRSRYL